MCHFDIAEKLFYKTVQTYDVIIHWIFAKAMQPCSCAHQKENTQKPEQEKNPAGRETIAPQSA